MQRNKGWQCTPPAVPHEQARSLDALAAVSGADVGASHVLAAVCRGRGPKQHWATPRGSPLCHPHVTLLWVVPATPTGGTRQPGRPHSPGKARQRRLTGVVQQLAGGGHCRGGRGHRAWWLAVCRYLRASAAFAECQRSSTTGRAQSQARVLGGQERRRAGEGGGPRLTAGHQGAACGGQGRRQRGRQGLVC